ncbi:MAG: protein kinase domain-containing protein [Candidatus Eiseniibacteriota bacterium]
MVELLERLRAALADSYHIERELGRGGTATVFLAQDLKHHRPVAIKVLDPELAATLGSDRFIQEIEIAGRLQHPHILTMLASGTVNGLIYYVMPFVEGESLRSRLEREHQLPVDDALRLACEVADALDAAHRHGVVHRDIKPENVLLSEGHAMVADFGIARAIRKLSGTQTTPAGSVLGTPIYMSPEQAVGSGEVDARSDIYSLACVLYEMLAGQPPFTGPTADSVVQQHLTLPPRPVTALRPAVPEAVARVLVQALAKTPADRFRDAGLFGRALAAARGPRRRPWEGLRFGWRAVARWTLGALLIVAAAIVVKRFLDRPPRDAARTVVVLPFTNFSGDQEIVYLCEGIPAEILGELVRDGRMNVVSQTTAWSFRGSGKIAQAIAKELGAGVIVEGTVQRRGARLKIDIRLIDGRTGLVVWSGQFDRTPEDIPRLPGEISAQVAATLVGGPPRGAPAAGLPSSPTASPEAYDDYLRAGRALDDPDDPEGPSRAAELYSKAIALDGGFAGAHAGLSKALWRVYTLTKEPATFRAAEEAASRAFELNPRLLEARIARAQMYRARGRHAESIADLLEILDVNPNWDEAHVQLGASYREAGDMGRAEASFRRAVEIRSGYWKNWNSLGALLWRKGDYPGARVAFEQIVKLTPEANRGYEQLAALAMSEGKYAEAIADYQRLPPPKDGTRASNMGAAYFFARRLPEAERYFLMAVGFEPKNPKWRESLGDLYLRQGRRGPAVAEYRKGVELVEAELALNRQNHAAAILRVLLLAKAGDCDRATADLETLLPSLAREDAQVAHSIARTQALCGHAAEALETVKRAIALGFSARLIREEDEFRALAHHPEYLRLTADQPEQR